jgi:hypothetical protein
MDSRPRLPSQSAARGKPGGRASPRIRHILAHFVQGSIRLPSGKTVGNERRGELCEVADARDERRLYERKLILWVAANHKAQKQEGGTMH